MAKKLAFILACSVWGSTFSFNVHAFPVSSPREHVSAPDVTPVRGFCGLGFHRGPHGYCVRNATPHVYPPPVLAPPEVGTPLACPEGYYKLFPYDRCLAPACTYGYYLGPHGQCYPYWWTTHPCC